MFRYLAVCLLCLGLSRSDRLISSHLITADRRVDKAKETEPMSCWERVVDGRRLHPQFIIRSVSAASLDECKRECEEVLFNCELVAYGVNQFRNTSCDLSDWEPSSLSFHPKSSDTIVSVTYSIHSRFSLRSTSSSPDRCSNRFEYRPTTTMLPSTTYQTTYRPTRPLYQATRPTYVELLVSEDVCYSQVFNGRRLSQRYVERSIAVIDLEECKLLCTRETAFDCKSFNYKNRETATNCDLSREDTDSLDIPIPNIFYADPDTDYYMRIGRGKACLGGGNRFPQPEMFQHYENAAIRPSSASMPQGMVHNGNVGLTSECFRRLKMGYRLDSRIVRQATSAATVSDCETLCTRSRHFACRSFSFRFPSSPSMITGQNLIDTKNCALSDLGSRELDPVRHLQVDRSADIYERNPQTASRNCRDVYTGSSLAPHSSSTMNKPAQCFERVKTGIRLERKAVRYTLSVNSPLECEQECVNTQFFTCRAFSYRFSESASLSEAYHKAHDNCDLSDVEWESLDPVYDIIEDANYDSWHRIGYSRECDSKGNRVPDNSGADSWPYQQRPNRPALGNLPHITTSGCYSLQRRGVRLNLRIIRDSVNVRSVAECEYECSRARQFVCQTFHFKVTAIQATTDQPAVGFNCELSDLSTRGLDRVRDLIEDAEYDLYSRSQYSPCSPQGLISTDTYPAGFVGNSAFATPGSPAASTFQFSGTGYTFQDVTVSGLRCRPGTFCRLDPEAGYWYCETGTKTSQWDYCCRPNHSCGFTEGTPFPWCYVGTDNVGKGLNSQWRPCLFRQMADRPYGYRPSPNGIHPSGKELNGTDLSNDTAVNRPVLLIDGTATESGAMAATNNTNNSTNI